MKVKGRKAAALAAALLGALMMMTGEGCASAVTQEREAVYLGVLDYGAPGIDTDHKDSFRYRFLTDGEEKVFFLDNGEEPSEYPLQNILKEGYSYLIGVREDTVVSASQTGGKDPAFCPVVSGEPGEMTLENFLRTALMPVGKTLYIYGGGWNWQDTAASVQARTLGVSPDWVRFFEENDGSFTYKDPDPAVSYYPFGKFNEYYFAGLDCSGYVGWVLYNTFETEDGAPGYVVFAKDFAKMLSERGYGTWSRSVSIPDGSGSFAMAPGDIMCMDGHVWISLGTCRDGSVVIVHSTPSLSRAGQKGGGVQIGAVGWSRDCEAYRLADHYMSVFYPQWYQRYETALKDPGTYFSFSSEAAGKFSWNVSGREGLLADPDHLQEMRPDRLLERLFR